jgi:hypothetical protein
MAGQWSPGLGPKLQAPKTKFQTSLNFKRQGSKQADLFWHWKLVAGICLMLGLWTLDFLVLPVGAQATKGEASSFRTEEEKCRTERSRTMRTWLLSAVAAVALGLGATANDASAAPAAPAKPVRCAPMVARHVRVAHRVWKGKRGHYGKFHRFAHYRHAPRRAYRHRR